MLKVFENKEFGEIRTVGNEGIWFVGKDIIRSLEYRNGSRDIVRHVEEEDRVKHRIQDGNQKREAWLINESGLYSLILSSKLPTAKKFKKWVTSEVLPSIRKSGKYERKQLSAMEMLELQFSVLKEQKEKIEEHSERLDKIENFSECSTGQITTIRKAVDKRVRDVLGSGLYTNAGLRCDTYRLLWRDYKDYFYISSYHSTLKKDYEMALEIIKKWRPQGELAKKIDNFKNLD